MKNPPVRRGDPAGDPDFRPAEKNGGQREKAVRRPRAFPGRRTDVPRFRLWTFHKENPKQGAEDPRSQRNGPADSGGSSGSVRFPPGARFR